jgi:hypothetical protein
MEVQERLPRRTNHRWRRIFTPEEDDRLRELVGKHGDCDWDRIASKIYRRDARQCRDRWCNYLSPHVVHSAWSRADDQLLEEKVAEMGRRWISIAPYFPGRTEINVRNRWNYLQKRSSRELERMPGTFEALIDSVIKEESDHFRFISGDLDSFDSFGLI